MKFLVFLSIFVICATNCAESLAVDTFCSDNNIQLGLFPHPDSSKCDTYILCVFMQTFIQQCEEGHIFLPKLDSDPSSGTCEPGYVEFCKLTTITESTTAIFPIETTPNPLPDDICKGHNIRFIPYPNVCWKYILCILERPNIGECESHQIFHQTLNICFTGNRETCRPCLFFC